jgi:hypothetical protein
LYEIAALPLVIRNDTGKVEIATLPSFARNDTGNVEIAMHSSGSRFNKLIYLPSVFL